MFYAIDIDTCMVESKHSDEKLLAKYISKYGLEEAVYLISSADDLALEFSLTQIKNIYTKYTKETRARTFEDEDEAAEFCWDALEDSAKQFPKFTPALGQELVHVANRRDGRSTAKSTSKTTNKPPAKSQVSEPSSRGGVIRAKDLIGQTIYVGSDTPTKRNHISLVEILEGSDGSMEFTELLETASFELDKTESLLRGYVTDGIRKGYFSLEEEL